MSELKHTYAGEMQFVRYLDSSKGGQTVTFVVPGRDELEAFIGLEGKRFQAVFVEIKEDEQPATVQPEPPKGGALARLAGTWCRDPMFIRWLRAVRHGEVQTEKDAAQIIYNICGIKSRAELDHDPLAASKFQDFIRHPFMDWLVMEQHS
jgi:hypothetical protein